MSTTNRVLAVIGAVGVLIYVSIAFASASFDPNTGIGFVGKGEVQSAFGWNNNTFQANAGGVSFAYVTMVQLSQECKIITPNPSGPSTITVVGVRTLIHSIGDTVAYTARSNKQISGFTLTGFSGDTNMTERGDWTCPEGSIPNGALVPTQLGVNLVAIHNEVTKVLK